MSRYLFPFLVLFGICCQGKPLSEPKVHIHDGRLVGKYSTSWDGHRYSIFQGIPYAQPPVGELRFLAPVKNHHWHGELYANEPPPKCNQIYVNGFEGQEDCLYLNVNTPRTFDNHEENHHEKLPVMVFFHGGAYIFGSGASYSGDFLMDYGVVLVTVNYRLGPFGFLSLNTSKVSGNQGLRDQQLALEWVKHNIHKFGGDHHKVTLFGESAGSWSVFHHLLSPESSGLFSSAIAQSGTPLGRLALQSHSYREEADRGIKFARDLNCSMQTDDQVLHCLQSAQVLSIMKRPFVPRGAVDGPISTSPFLPQNPEILLREGNFNQVPLMMGINNGEGILFAQVAFGVLNVPYFLINTMWDLLGPATLREKRIQDISEADVQIAKAAKQYYMKPLGIISEQGMQEFINMYTDALFSFGVYASGQLIAAHDQEPVYQYQFTHDGPNHLFDFKNFSSDGFGVNHGDELLYLFHMSSSDYSLWTQKDHLTSKRMLTMWTNFAKYGNPTPTLTEEVTEYWEPVQLMSHKYMEIGDNCSMVLDDKDFVDRMNFWLDTLNAFDGGFVLY